MFFVAVLTVVLPATTLSSPPPPAYASTAPVGGWQCQFETGDADGDGTSEELLTTAPCLSVSKTEDVNPVTGEFEVKGYNFDYTDSVYQNLLATYPGFKSVRDDGSGTFFGGVYIALANEPFAFPAAGEAALPMGSTLSNRWARFGGTPAFTASPDTITSSTPNFTTTFNALSSISGLDTSNFSVVVFPGGFYSTWLGYTPMELKVPIEVTPSSAPRLGLSTNPAQPKPDQPFTFEVLVNPDDAAGSLTLSGSGVSSQTKTIEDGLATFSIPATEGGLYNWSIAFAPDEPLLHSARTMSFSLAIDDGSGEALFVSEPTESGYLKWGVKSTFRSYITGSIAKGSISTTEAGRTGSQFLFGQAQPVLDTEQWSQVAYRGAVTFRGHSGVLNVTLANPRISKVSDSRATLSADFEGSRVTIAELNLARGAKTSANGLLSYTDVPATLLSTGVGVFSYNGAGFYPAGEALDPVSFSIGAIAGVLSDTVVEEYQQPEPASETDSALFTELASTEGACTVADSTLDWGIKESFRSYVSGAIANGEWKATDGAAYDTPTFSFSHSEGSLNVTSTRGLLSFAGVVNFTGHDGLLDVTMSQPTLAIESDAQATLYLTFEGQTMDGEETSTANLPFARVDLSSGTVTDDGLRKEIVDAPAYLTSQGARALGTYQAGDQLDSLSISILTGLGCDSNNPATAVSTDTTVANADTEASAVDQPLRLPATVGLIGLGLGLGAMVSLSGQALYNRMRSR